MSSIAANSPQDRAFVNERQVARDLWVRRIGRVGLWFNPIF